MTINPYEPPQAPIGPPSPVDAADAGPWRDGALMVVRVKNSGPLHWRCVLTGVPVGPGQLFVRQLSYVPKTNSFMLARPVEIAFYWPVADAARPWVVPQRFTQFVVIASAVACAIGMGFIPGVSVNIRLASLASLLPLAAVLGICSRIDRFQTRGFSSILRAEDGFAWVQGLHADFLAELRPWPGGPHE